MNSDLEFVDTHAHLADNQFAEDIGGVLRRAHAMGVTSIVAVAVDGESARRTLSLAGEHEAVFAAAGIHPSEAGRFDVQQLNVRAILDNPKVVAVGEIGLDYGRCLISRDVQLRAFRAQVSLAVEYDLPVVIHDREAHDDVLDVIRELRPRGVLHCFSGDAAMAEQASLMGMHISFAGNLTYKNAASLHDAARTVPLSSLLIETDSPYLPPQPLRGKRNEPANVIHVAERLAELRGMGMDEIASHTSRNARVLFRLGELST